MKLFKNENFINIDYIKEYNDPLNNITSPKKYSKLSKSKEQEQNPSKLSYASSNLHKSSNNQKNEIQKYQKNKNLNRMLTQSVKGETLIRKKYKKIQIGQKYLKNIDYGIFNKYRLDEFFDRDNNAVQQQGEIIPVVSITSHALHLEQKFINLMQKYNQFQLIFIGVYGARNSGKSIFLDKILNLATFQGSHFTKDKKPKSKKQICLWNIPINRGKQKIFMVDCTGFQLHKQAQRQDQMLQDFLFFLCSKIIFIPSLQDQTNQVLQQSYKLLKQSMARLRLNKQKTQKSHFYWPQGCSYLYRTVQKPQSVPVKKLFMNYNVKRLVDLIDEKYVLGSNEEVNLKEIFLTKFADKNKRIIRDQYLDCCSHIVKQIYQTSHPKFFFNVKPNGNGISNLLMNLVLNLNCRQKINIQSVINQSRKQILAQSYNISVKKYNSLLQRELKQEHPKSSQQLLGIFQKAYYKALSYYKRYYQVTLIQNYGGSSEYKSKFNEEKLRLQEKLQHYIRQKQLLILKINQKKSTKQLKDQINKKIQIKHMPLQQIIEIRQILYKSKTIQRKLDINRVQCIKDKIIQGWNKYQFNENKKEKQILQRLQTQLQIKKSELTALSTKNFDLKMKVNQKMQKYNNMIKQSGQLQTKMENLKYQINIQKNKNRQLLENSYDKIHIQATNEQQLLQMLRDYHSRLFQKYQERERQLKILRQEMEEAYRIQNEQMKKMQTSIPKTNSFINKGAMDGSINSINNVMMTNSKYSPQRPIATSLSNLPDLPQFSFTQKNQQVAGIGSTNKLISSRIGRSSQSVKLLKAQIDNKVRMQQQIYDMIENSYINFSRVKTEYKNNTPRKSQIRSMSKKKYDSQRKRQQNSSQNPKKNIYTAYQDQNYNEQRINQNQRI